MYYINSSILDTDADNILVPVNMDGVIKPGTLQHLVAGMEGLGEKYREEYFRNVRKGYLTLGEPDMFFPDEGRWAGHAVWNIPALYSMSTSVNLAHVMKALGKLLKWLDGDERVTVAIPHLCPGVMSWETMDYVLGVWEADEVAGSNVEVWVYPPLGAGEEPEGVGEERTVVCV